MLKWKNSLIKYAWRKNYLQVARDQAVKNWAFIEQISLEEPDYGSGYPGG